MKTLCACCVSVSCGSVLIAVLGMAPVAVVPSLSTPPTSPSGFQCDATATKCVAWGLMRVDHFQHVGQGVMDPPCATDPKKAEEQLAEDLQKTKDMFSILGTALGSYGGGFGAAAGGIIGKAIGEAASPDTPLGQLLNPPANKARCQMIAVKIPAGAVVSAVAYWVDDLKSRSIGRGGVFKLPPEKGKLTRTKLNQDVSWAKFSQTATTRSIERDGSNAGAFVWTVFKNWSGGIDRYAGLTVAYTLRAETR